MPNGQIVTTWTTPYRSHAGIGRLMNHMIWAWTVYRAALKTPDRPDIIFVSSPPLTAAYLMQRLAKAKRALLILDIVDLWPEAFEIIVPSVLRRISKLAFAPLMALETENFRGADALTAVSKIYLLNALTRSGNKPSIVAPYGIDLDNWPSSPKPDRELDGNKVKVCYAGTLGPHHDVETIVRAAKLLESEQDIEFIIAGDGPLRGKLQALATSLGLSNLTFTGWMEVVPLRQMLMTCQIGILAVSQGSVISIPLKTFDYMAAGLALIHSVLGELEQLVRDNALGASYIAGSPESLAEAIRQLAKDREAIIAMGQRSRKLVEEEFDRKKILERLMNFMLSLVTYSSVGAEVKE